MSRMSSCHPFADILVRPYGIGAAERHGLATLHPADQSAIIFVQNLSVHGAYRRPQAGKKPSAKGVARFVFDELRL